MQNKGLVPAWGDPNHFRQRGLGGEWVTCDWSEVDSVEAGYVCYVTLAVTTLHNTQETNIYQLKQKINNTTLSTLSGDQHEKMFSTSLSPRVAFILFIIYLKRWFFPKSVFFWYFEELKKMSILARQSAGLRNHRSFHWSLRTLWINITTRWGHQGPGVRTIRL